ncbi:hypothetical protein RRG08_024873 [Elysia crispata]|uniref:Uncharacterized protein n=1 Tax=Elysia crispata TaxID=231223 RepID=A0AAE1CZT0_9GAST|nr:hypothetical protein RRG08_024873 [Elysia crispata]
MERYTLNPSHIDVRDPYVERTCKHPKNAARSKRTNLSSEEPIKRPMAWPLHGPHSPGRGQSGRLTPTTIDGRQGVLR